MICFADAVRQAFPALFSDLELLKQAEDLRRIAGRIIV
jgi:hypothetical protein